MLNFLSVRIVIVTALVVDFVGCFPSRALTLFDICTYIVKAQVRDLLSCFQKDKGGWWATGHDQGFVSRTPVQKSSCHTVG